MRLCIKHIPPSVHRSNVCTEQIVMTDYLYSFFNLFPHCAKKEKEDVYAVGRELEEENEAEMLLPPGLIRESGDPRSQNE